MNKKIDLKLLGKNVKKYRIGKGMTQEKLADLAGLSMQFIGNIERGHATASLETIMKICFILDVTPNHLLITSTKASPNALIEQIVDSLSNLSTKNLKHILDYIEFLKKSDVF